LWWWPSLVSQTPSLGLESNKSASYPTYLKVDRLCLGILNLQLVFSMRRGELRSEGVDSARAAGLKLPRQMVWRVRMSDLVGSYCRIENGGDLTFVIIAAKF